MGELVMNTDVISHRLDFFGDQWRLRSFRTDTTVGMVETRTQGVLTLDDMPEWLTDIVSMAKAGGYTIKFYEPPPDALMWFETDRDMHLIRFTNQMET